MPHDLPKPETLAKYMCLLRIVLVQARSRLYDTDPQVAELLDAVPVLDLRGRECRSQPAPFPNRTWEGPKWGMKSRSRRRLRCRN